MKFFALFVALVCLISTSSALQRERSVQRKFKRQSYGNQLPSTPTASQYGGGGGGYGAPSTGGAPAGGGAYRSPAPAPVYAPTSAAGSGGYSQRVTPGGGGGGAGGGGPAGGGYGQRPSSGGQQGSAPAGVAFGGGQQFGGGGGGGQQFGGGGGGGGGGGAKAYTGGQRGDGQDYDDNANPLPGVAGQDYPTYGPHPPQTNFNCLNVQHVPGYYANPDYQCQVFHICEPGGKVSTFLCPNGTIFNQKYFVCDWWYNVNCGEATSFYGVNGNLFQVPESSFGGRLPSGGGGGGGVGGGVGGGQPAGQGQGVYSAGPSQGPSGSPQVSYGASGGARQQPQQPATQYGFAPSAGTSGY